MALTSGAHGLPRKSFGNARAAVPMSANETSPPPRRADCGASQLERPALPAADQRGNVEHDGARISYALYGIGRPVVLLHGGLGNSEDWGNQLAVLVARGYRVVLIDSRGHGRSTRDTRPFHYELMASDVVAVLDHLHIERTAIAGWSDGAIIALVLAMTSPLRISGVFAFGVNMDLSGVKQLVPGDPLIAFVFGRLINDYARLSETPAEFEGFSAAVNTMMATEPDYNAQALSTIRVPIAIVYGEHDEFITREHVEYLARSIPGARLIVLSGVSHFAPMQDPSAFNAALLRFLAAL